jgi:hypothetical protein
MLVLVSVGCFRSAAAWGLLGPRAPLLLGAAGLAGVVPALVVALPAGFAGPRIQMVALPARFAGPRIQVVALPARFARPRIQPGCEDW